ncbi:hypothetical protein [Cohnella abietis]|uniref:Uncharacterized protein n=1 Tax=Cohnella abietis TaxID=2507935 RepID=A0A3T1D0R9_9BACL|nr:hypothetical protein [Cohnella abietis]BBI31658.1 hypothetical protein KCTCHS21_10570 [Cohnella abietis]
MKPEQELIKRQLEEELELLRFSRGREVLERTHPRSWRSRLKAFWNKEIELPVIPLGVGIALIATIVMIAQLDKDEHRGADAIYLQKRQLIEIGGNTYWKDDYEKAVSEDESNP